MKKYKCSHCKNSFLRNEVVKASKRINTENVVVQYYWCNKCNTDRLREYRNTPKGKANIYRAVYKSIKKHQAKQDARLKLNDHLKRGKLFKQDCHCGSKKVEAHHPNYSKPLEVIWLCRTHHSLLHRKIKQTRV